MAAAADGLLREGYGTFRLLCLSLCTEAPSIGDFLRINEGCILGRNQLGSFYDETVEQCKGRCGNDYSCRSFDYVHTYRSCHLSTDNRITARAAFDSCPSWLRLQTDYYEKVTELLSVNYFPGVHLLHSPTHHTAAHHHQENHDNMAASNPHHHQITATG
uniref:Apple domain-containing protein n=1 Tax=Branchiostoma floridae TaxID=7739 RepID=C3XUJ8_BRAFL|eukprot:XP_002612271.1 hypothetical protein BRAFLDRAFT_104894 [Branchiostoma floridae]